MEYHGGGGATVLSGSNVPAFLTKLWTLVEDPDTDPLICWSKVQKLAWFSPARRAALLTGFTLAKLLNFYYILKTTGS